MKKLLLVLSLLSRTVLFSQTVPKGISYQAVAINTEAQSVAGVNPENTYWSNKDIQVRFTIYDQYPGGTAQMVETHQTKTDKFGVFNVIIGQGQNESGDLFDVDWDKGQAHLKVEIDFNNEGLYKLVGIERFWSVPYALNSAGSTSGGGSGPDLSKKLDSLADALNKQIADFRNQINGDIANLNQGDTSSDNELQELELNGNDLGLSKSNKTVDISTILKDNVIGNELQSIALVNDTLMISGLDTFSGGIELSKRLALNYDKSETNELQELIYRNDSLMLSVTETGIPLSTLGSAENKKNTTSYNYEYTTPQPNCFPGDFIDLSSWAENNGWSKAYTMGKVADSLFLFSAGTSDNSSVGYFVYDAKDGSITSTSARQVYGICDSFFTVVTSSGSCSLFKVNYKREIESTGKGVSGKFWRSVPIVNTKGDLIWVESDKGIPQDIKKFNFSSGVTNTYSNSSKGTNEGGFFRLNGDTLLIGNVIFDSKTMTQIKSLPSGIFSKSSIQFYSYPFLYFSKDSRGYRYDLEKGVTINLGGSFSLVGKVAGGSIVSVGSGSNGSNLGGISLNSVGNIFITREGGFSFIGYGSGINMLSTGNLQWVNRDGSLTAYIQSKSDGTIESHCVNGKIPRSKFGFTYYY